MFELMLKSRENQRERTDLFPNVFDNSKNEPVNMERMDDIQYQFFKCKAVFDGAIDHWERKVYLKIFFTRATQMEQFK